MLKIVWILLAVVICSGAYAIQPVEAGLRPLHERLKVIHEEQHRLNERLRASDTPLERRVAAYRSWKIFELERLKLVESIREARKLAESPGVAF